MNSKHLEVKASTVHGRGLFATIPFRAGDVVVRWANTREITKEELEALPSTEKNYIDVQGERILLVGEPERYVNHSCNANTKPGCLCDIASREIAIGEEITADYSHFHLPSGPFQCNCGAKACKGTIKGTNG
jgi:SET domain-containing protein